MKKKHVNCVIYSDKVSTKEGGVQCVRVAEDGEVRSKRFQSVFDSILYPSIIESISINGNADHWIQKVAEDAERIRTGALDDQIQSLCHAYEQYAAVQNDIDRFNKEIDALNQQIEECIQKKPFYMELMRRYEQSHFTINLRPHETIDKRCKHTPWSIIRCPVQQCQGFVDFGSSKGTCCTCGTIVCEACHRQMEGCHVCKTEDIESVARMVSDSKPCPACLRPIYRESGCTHMHCSVCGYDYDWVSLKPLSKEETTNRMAGETPQHDSSSVELIQPAVRLVKQHMEDDVDAIAIIHHIERQGWIHTVLTERQWFSILQGSNSKHCHPIFKCEGAIQTILILLTCLCASVVHMLHATRNSHRQEDVERYKYLSGIKDQYTYEDILYNQKKEMLALEKHHIPKVCHMIRELSEIIKPVLTAFKTKIDLQNIQTTICIAFDQWWIDQDPIPPCWKLDTYLKERSFRKMLPQDRTK